MVTIMVELEVGKDNKDPENGIVENETDGDSDGTDEKEISQE